MIFLIAFIILLLDQISKYFITYKFSLGESLPIIPHVFHFTYVTNTGTAFSLFRGNNTAFVALSIACVLGIIFFHKKIFPLSNDGLWKGMRTAAIGFLLGGACGNLIDRIVYGSVIDFIDFRIWPVFNIADSAISVAAILLAVYIWKRH